MVMVSGKANGSGGAKKAAPPPLLEGLKEHVLVREAYGSETAKGFRRVTVGAVVVEVNCAARTHKQGFVREIANILGLRCSFRFCDLMEKMCRNFDTNVRWFALAFLAFCSILGLCSIPSEINDNSVINLNLETA